MKTIRAFLRRFCQEEEGVTAIEYALVASLIAVAIIGAVLALSGSVQQLWNRISTCVANPSSCA